MRKIRDVLRLHADKLSKRRIAVSVNLGRTAVRDYIKRATRAGLSWPLPEGLCDEALERLLFPPPIQGHKRAAVPDRRLPPDWPALHRELKRPGVTLSLLWEEYRAAHPEGYGYSRFCDLYRAWKGKLKPWGAVGCLGRVRPRRHLVGAPGLLTGLRKVSHLSENLRP